MGYNIMTTNKVLNYMDLDLTKINYSEMPIKQRGGYYFTEMLYNLDDISSKIVINDSRSYIELLLDKNSENFYNLITNLDELTVNTAAENSENWFNEKYSIDVIDDFYCSQIRLSKKKIPSIRVKIPLTKGEVIPKFFDFN